MSSLRLRATLAFVVICAALTGCTPPSLTARAPTFEPAQLDQATIILSFSGGSDAGLLGSETNPELTDQLRLKAGHELIRSAAHFGAEISEPPPYAPDPALLQGAVDAYVELRSAAKKSVESQAPLDLPVPPPLVVLAEDLGAQRALVLYTTGWRMTTGNRVLSTVALDPNPRSGIGVEAMLIDGPSSEVEWFGQHYADMDPAEPEHIEAVTAALAFELFTGRRVSAFSFLPWPEGGYVTVWMYEGERVSGKLVGRDGFEVILKRDDGTEQRVPLENVRSIQRISGARVFPSQRHASAVRRPF